jgi:hypothetical protein
MSTANAAERVLTCHVGTAESPWSGTIDASRLSAHDIGINWELEQWFWDDQARREPRPRLGNNRVIQAAFWPSRPKLTVRFFPAALA